MTTTVFITHCSKNRLRRVLDDAGSAGATLRAVVAFLLAAALWVVAAPVRASEITTLRLERGADGVLLTAQLRFDLSPAVEEALQKGIPLFFVADAVILRERWYWTDQEVAGATRHMRLTYQPLTRRWRVVVGNSTIGHTGLALGQTYDSRDEALATVQRISGWKIADPGEIESDQRYTVSLRFRLDTSQLPRPFQIGVVGSADWNLAATRNQRLDPQK